MWRNENRRFEYLELHLSLRLLFRLALTEPNILKAMKTLGKIGAICNLCHAEIVGFRIEIP